MSHEAEYRIRRATVDDIPVFIDFRSRMFREVGMTDVAGVEAVSPAYFSRTIPSGEFIALLAESVDGDVVGSAGLVPYTMPPKPRQPDGRFGYVSSMYVLPEHRRRGLAHRLMQAIIDAADGLGLTWITLHASPAGRPIYEEIGFEAWAEMGIHVPTAIEQRPGDEAS